MAEITSTSTKKLSHPKSIPWKRLALVAGVFFVVVFLIWAIPAGLAIYYQNLGGSAIQQVIKEIDEYQSVTTYCYPPSVTDEQRSTLETAREELEISVAIKPDYAHTKLLLGCVNCLLRNPEEAASAYQRYTDLRPDNPLGHMIPVFAIESSRWQNRHNGLFIDELSVNTSYPDNDLQNYILTEWKKTDDAVIDWVQYI